MFLYSFPNHTPGQNVYSFGDNIVEAMLVVLDEWGEGDLSYERILLQPDDFGYQG